MFRYHIIGVFILAAGLLSVLAAGDAAAGDLSRRLAKPQSLVSAANLGSGFTYQGSLWDNDTPVDDSCDFSFTLFDDALGGDQVGTTETESNVTVSEGRFTVTLNEAGQFSADAFSGQARWLELAVRCPAGSGSYITLSPRQELTPAPYALSLQPGATISGTTPSDTGILNLANGDGDGLAVLSAGSDGLFVDSAGGNGLYVDAAGFDGLHVGSAGGHGLRVSAAAGNGVRVDSAGEDGIRVNSAGLDGVHVETAGSPSTTASSTLNNGFEISGAEGYGLFVGRADYNGVWVHSAGITGVAVLSAAHNGVAVGSAASDGMIVLTAGTPSTTNSSASNNGFEIQGAQGHGLYIGRADFDGLFVDSAGFSGVAVGSVGTDGLLVASAGDDGVDVTGDNLAGFFQGDVQVTGSCTGCALATFGVNSSQQTLEPGAIVALQGTQPARVDSVPLLLEVSPARSGQTVVGVVQGRAELVMVDQPRPDELGQRLVPREGAAAPGEYVTIIIYGLAQVQASTLSGPIMPGERLAVDEAGAARRLQTRELDGMIITEGAPTVGVALEGLATGEEGLIWVLVGKS